MTAALTDPLVSPYKGLANYTEQDAALFFGRDREREVIIANLKARRLTLLYGESGVGKSSLLHAGVMSDLTDAARRNVTGFGTPEHVPVAFSEWRDDPLLGLGAAIRAAARPFIAEPEEPPDSASLAEVIGWAAGSTDAYLLVILDQFEEYFLYHPIEEGADTFAVEFPEIVNRSRVQANFLISIREDALAKLDRFRRDIPRLFDSALRVNHLDVAAAREAIRRPVDHYNSLAEPDERVVLEAALVDEVIEQVRTGRVVLEQTGQGTLEHGDAASGADRIETPYLQLVMSRLWDVEEQRASPTLRLATLTALGGAQEIVRTHLDAALRDLDPKQRDTAAALFHQLVTPSGSKIAHAVPDLAEYAGRPEAEVNDLLEALARPQTRILRPVPPPPGEEGPPRYEIFHDVLAPSVLAWRTRHTAARRIEEQRRAARAVARRRLRRLVGVLGALGAVGLAAVVVAVVASAQRNEARRLAAEKSRQEARALLFAHRATQQAKVARSRTRQLAGANRRLATTNRRTRALSNANRRNAAQARALAQDNQRRAAEAQALAQDNRRQATRSRALAAENRRRAQRAQVLAEDNRRQARRARKAAAQARRLAAVNRRRAEQQLRLSLQLQGLLKLVPPIFVPRMAWSYRWVGSVYWFTWMVVIAPPGSVVTAACVPRGCGRFERRAEAPPGVMRITTFDGRVIPHGDRFMVVVSGPDVRTEFEFRFRRSTGPVLKKTSCRPLGSSLPPADAPACA